MLEKMMFKLWMEAIKETMTLYRGDSKKYSTHSVSKGDVNALFGQGIYLTNSVRIAGDYTVKGNENLFNYSGSQGRVSKQQVIDAYIRRAAGSFDENGKETYYQTSLPGMTNDPIRIKRLEYAKQHWDKIKNQHEVRIGADGNATIKKKGSGHISEYVVPLDVINRTLNAESPVDDDVLSAMCRGIQAVNGECRELLDIARENEDGETPSFREIYRQIADPLMIGLGEEKAQIVLRKELKRLGYTGVEYSGGTTIGGAGQHRAFVFWDEQGLKKYRVN